MRRTILALAVACGAVAWWFHGVLEERRGYGERLMAIGFDDFRESDFAMVEPLFAKYGAHATFNCIARNGTLDGRTLARLARLEEGGNEVGDHTWRHWNHLFADPLANGQDPAHPEGGQVPFPSNAQMREDRGDGRNAFASPLSERLAVRLRYETPQVGLSDTNVTWRTLDDGDCQALRNFYSVYANADGMLDLFDELSNRYLGTSGRSRGSWDAAKGRYTGGIFTGCATSANHEIWERVLSLTRAAFRDQYRRDFGYRTWSWPGSPESPCFFRRGSLTYYDADCTKPRNTLSRFPSSLRRGPDGRPYERSWVDALREAGYVVSHDMVYPGRWDGTPRTMMRCQLFANASFSRRDALAYSTDRTISYALLPKAYPESFFTNAAARAEVGMYDGGGLFRAFIEGIRHDTARGLVHGEVIDSENTFSERTVFDAVLRYARQAGVRVVTKDEAFRACFGRTCVSGNLIRNSGFRNTAAEFMPEARTVPPNPDGYTGACHVTGAGDCRTLVTDGPTENILFGVPTGRLRYSVEACGKGTIRIQAIRNRDEMPLKDSEPLAEIRVSGAAFAVLTADIAVPDASETAYETRWEGLGDKVMGLRFVYSEGLSLRRIRLEKPSFASWLLRWL